MLHETNIQNYTFTIYDKKQYCDKQIEHKAVKKKWDTLVFSSFYSQCRQVIKGLSNTTSSYCLPFKIYPNKIDLKSLNVLIIYGL